MNLTITSNPISTLKSSRKYLLVIDNLGSGGAQNQMISLALALENLGDEVHIFTYYPQNFFGYRLETTSIIWHAVDKKGKLGLNVINSLIRLLRNENFDATLAYLHTPNLYLSLAAKIVASKSKVVISHRSKTTFSQLSYFALWRKRLTLHLADVAVANSHHERLRWQKEYPTLASKWQTIYNLIDLNKYTPLPQRRKKYRNIFVGVGKVRPLKNIGLLLAAMASIKRQGGTPPIVHWYGEKEYGNPNLEQNILQLEAYVAEEGLENYFVWKGATEHLHQHLPHYKALIHPSLLEGLPNAVCEGMSCGLPILVSAILDHPRLVVTGENGWLFEPHSITSIQEAIEQIQSLSEDELVNIGQRSRLKSEVLFSGEVITNQYKTVLDASYH